MKTFLSLLFIIFTLSGCSDILYISKLGWYQSYITFHSIPIQEVLENQEIDNELKKKILFIQEVKRFGEERLGLKKTKNYSKFFEIKRPILYVVTASEKERLQSYSWKFPVIGKVTYKSFFKLKDALKEEEKLRKKGFDTFIQSVCTYSTLGWFRDPIFSSLLNLDEPILANVILHEMVHSTIYFKGETELNEQIATFIGNQGAIEFLIEKYGVDSEAVFIAKIHQDDDYVFSKWIDQVFKELSEFYNQPIPREEKLRMREEVFESIKEKFKEIKSKLKTEIYKDFDKIKLNNAIILAYKRYIHHLGQLEALYRYLGSDLKRFIQFLQKVKEFKISDLLNMRNLITSAIFSSFALVKPFRFDKGSLRSN